MNCTSRAPVTRVPICFTNLGGRIHSTPMYGVSSTLWWTLLTYHSCLGI
ncbi:hypothetical protein OH768_41215 [Streptomyces sp. NBC_01622]|nr:hypothetical protein OH768_41215 [Streptomyces sp. NBC_01622]